MSGRSGIEKKNCNAPNRGSKVAGNGVLGGRQNASRAIEDCYEEAEGGVTFERASLWGGRQTRKAFHW